MLKWSFWRLFISTYEKNFIVFLIPFKIWNGKLADFNEGLILSDVKIKINQEVLDYHEQGRPGKNWGPKPYSSWHLSISAHSPGVAGAMPSHCRQSNDVYKYTAKGKSGSCNFQWNCCIGIGKYRDRKHQTGDGRKGLLFRKISLISMFDIEINENDVDKFVETVKAISPTFGGINLEDIKARSVLKLKKTQSG